MIMILLGLPAMALLLLARNLGRSFAPVHVVTIAVFMVSGVHFPVATSTSVLADENDTHSSARSQQAYESYRGLVMTGYQGWFNAETDGAGKKWTHYSREGRFEPGHCSIDFWPDTSEYEKKYKTPFSFEDGSPAYVFSSYDASTVALHFQWMAEYGIDGAFMQRFIHKLEDPKVANHYDRVFESAITVATKCGRAISIRYDLTQMPKGHSRVLLEDLDKLNKKYGFFKRSLCPTFLRHEGKPLIAIGGVGFSDDIAGADDVGYLDEAAIIVSELRKRGYSILIRVPAQWRELRGDLVVQTSEQQARLHEIIQTCDILMPWHVGAYREGTYVGGKWQQRIAEDILWCTAHGIEYVPVIFPGFSRANLKGGEDGSFRPRNQGSFYWLQAVSAVRAGATMLFVAQFDEMDEGTQIFKCSQRVPAGKSPFVPYEDDVQTDHYLWLTGAVGEMLRGERDRAVTMPRR